MCIAQFALYLYAPCVDGEEGRGSGPPLKKIGFLNKTVPDPLKNKKATKPSFNSGPLSARQWAHF